MNYKKAFNSAAGMAAIASLALGGLQAYAETSINANAGVSVGASVSGQQKHDAGARDALSVSSKTRADQEIDRRIVALSRLSASVNSMKRISASEKSSLTASIQEQLKLMADLKAKIKAETTADALKTDIKSITSSYRIFALIVPRGHIIAAADKALDIVNLTADISAKLETRIAAAAAAGNNVSTLQAELADMRSSAADAEIQAQAALDLVADLSPDGGDQVKMESNKQALKAARAKISVAAKDLEALRKDIRMIIVGLKTLNLKAEGNVSASSE